MPRTTNVHIQGQSLAFSNTTNGNINHIYPSSDQIWRGFKILMEHVTTGAFHNSGEVSDPPKCHPGTRIAILNSLYAWAVALAYMYAFKWVHGPAGSGKSAIMRTLAGMLEERGLLLAAFFFFRASADRNTARLFIPTIAYQICQAIPAFKPLIVDAIDAHPLIFSQSLESQARLLIVQPLSRLHQTGTLPPSYPRVIIVDGLDECLDPNRQIEVLRILTMILSELPISFVIFIASRPEPHIRDAFDNGELNQLSSRLVLDDSYKPDADIKKFLGDRFLNIYATHRLRSYLPNPWPPPTILDLLVDRASGQFVFASTVIKFVEPPRYNPAERLNIILSPNSRQDKLKPFEQLDTLYSTIFCRIPSDELLEVLRILGVLLVPHSTQFSFHAFSGWGPFTVDGDGIIFPRSPNLLASLLGITALDIRQHLYDLESLLQVKEDDEDIQIFHASLADFVFDQFRSGRFYINPARIHEEICQKCVQLLSSSSDPVLDQYMMCNFRYHLQQATPTPELHFAVKDCDINTFPLSHYCLHQVFPEFLDGVQASKFHDAGALHSQLMNKYKQFISQHVDIYFEQGLSHLLLLASDKPWTQDCVELIQVAQGIDVADLLAVPHSALELVNGNGGLPVLDLVLDWYHMQLLPRILVTEILGERIHSCYAQFIFHLLKHIMHPSPDRLHVGDPEIYISKDNKNVDWICNIAPIENLERNLKMVMSMAAPQLELVKFIQKHSLHCHLENNSKIANILSEYVLQTEKHFRF